jgi:hypothetical protein
MSIRYISLVCVIGVLTCISIARAEPRPWMAQDQSETLAYFASLDDNCRPSRLDLNEIVTDAFTAANIAPAAVVATEPADFFLRVDLYCLGLNRGADLLEPGRSAPILTQNKKVFMLDVQFETARFDNAIVEFPDQYGTFGRRDEAAIKDAVRSAVEEAVTDYLEAQSLFAPATQDSASGDVRKGAGPWVIQGDPDTLAYRTSLDETCRPDRLDVNEIVGAVLAEAEIVPLPIDTAESADLFLRVGLHCLERDRGLAIFRGRDERVYSLDVKFGTSRFDGFTVEYPEQYGSFGVQDLLGLEDAVRSAVEGALTAYMVAREGFASRDGD